MSRDPAAAARPVLTTMSGDPHDLTVRVLCLAGDAEMASALRRTTPHVVHLQAAASPAGTLVREITEELYTLAFDADEVDRLHAEVLAGRPYAAVVCEHPDLAATAELLAARCGAPWVPLRDLGAHLGRGDAE